MESQTTSLTIVYSTVYSRRSSKKTSNRRVTGLCEGNSLLRWIPRKKRASNGEMLPFDDVIMLCGMVITDEFRWFAYKGPSKHAYVVLHT